MSGRTVVEQRNGRANINIHNVGKLIHIPLGNNYGGFIALSCDLLVLLVTFLTQH